jgi:hypothetical protein
MDWERNRTGNGQLDLEQILAEATRQIRRFGTGKGSPSVSSPSPFFGSPPASTSSGPASVGLSGFSGRSPLRRSRGFAIACRGLGRSGFRGRKGTTPEPPPSDSTMAISAPGRIRSMLSRWSRSRHLPRLAILAEKFEKARCIPFGTDDALLAVSLGLPHHLSASPRAFGRMSSR